MGHHISKQQNQQPDGQQMTSSIEKHTEPSTTARNLQQVNVSKNKHLANAKKLKKEQNHRRDVKSIKAIAAAKSVNQERSTGSVVITIRLLKMESTKSYEANTTAGGGSVVVADAHTDGISNSKYSSDKSQPKPCDSEKSSGKPAVNYVNLEGTNGNNQISNSSNLNSNELANQSEMNCSWINGYSNINCMKNCDGTQNEQIERNSIKKQYINLRSEDLICDKSQANCTSQHEQQIDTVNNTLSTMKLTEPPAHTQDNKTTPVQSSPTTFIPSHLMGSVSPYPHHIPIANFIRSDANLKTALDKNGQNVDKHTGANKDTTELKAKKQNLNLFNCAKLKGIKSLSSHSSFEPSSVTAKSTAPSNTVSTTSDVSTQQPTALLLDKSALFSTSGGNVIVVTMDQPEPWYASDDYSIEDCDEQARLQRELEIEEGVEPPPGFISPSSMQNLNKMPSSNFQMLPNTVANTVTDAANKVSTAKSKCTMVISNPQQIRLISLLQADGIPRIHSQVDFIHCLVPDLKQITNCSFYWGKMDRYEAERLLENKPEGTFLLRDSAQEEFLFSVSFRKYGRSLHARIEQFNHKFSFDCHDPGVYTSKTVTGLLEHYKDPACVMFFEPALTLPLNRNFVFSLQQLCRATIVSHTSYDGINDMCLPKKLKSYLKEYHYKQRVRVKRFDESNYSAT